MFLKYNISTINVNNKKIDVDRYEISKTTNGYYYVIKVTTRTPHNLSVGDKLLFTLNDNNININSSELIILEDDFSTKTFSFTYPYYTNVYIKKITKGDEEDLIETETPLPLIKNKLVNNKFNIRIVEYRYIPFTIGENNDNILNTTIEPSNYYLGGDYVNYYSNIYKWESEVFIYECEYVSEYYFKYKLSENNNRRLDEKLIEIIDDRFIKNNNINEKVFLFEYYSYLNINFPVVNNNMNKYNNENIIHAYFNEKKNELITNIDDYEKRCFTPYYKNGNKLEPIDSIKFNLFFRDRTGSDNWTSNDVMGWNQYKLEKNGSGLSFVNNLTTEGDLISCLNFTDDDIYYRKKKVKKTFLRLSFYSSNNPLNNMLLFYSTIFLDSADLYNKYITCVNSNKVKPIVSNQESNLTVSFKTTDKYSRTNSSEGFYLYLFPDNIDNEQSRKIYMKVEFNHAGNGKTIPLIYPNSNNTILGFGNNFPTSFINEENTNLNEYYRQLYIPLTIKYDTTLKEYVYYFDLVNRNNEENSLVFNLYEPKINSHS